MADHSRELSFSTKRSSSTSPNKVLAEYSRGSPGGDWRVFDVEVLQVLQVYKLSFMDVFDVLGTLAKKVPNASFISDEIW